MKRASKKITLAGAVLLASMPAAFWLTPVAAQMPADRYGNEHAAGTPDYYAGDAADADIVILTQPELDELVGPIALYPDDLLAIVLPASTYPLDVIEAARFLDKHEHNASARPDEDWDESVTALLNYPEVVHLLNDDVDWMWKLGGAVLNQQQDVIEAVERFRDRAYAAGNLRSDEYQTVSHEGDAIEILPVDEEVIYVPYYEPREVVVRHVTRVYYYYPRPRPVYYYPYPAGHYFFRDSFWGVTTAYRIGWSNRYLNVWHYTYRGHPYYGHRYSFHYRRPAHDIHHTRYVRGSGRYADRHRHGDRWRPRRGSTVRLGDRPRRAVRHDRIRTDTTAGNTGRHQDRDRYVHDSNHRYRQQDSDLSTRGSNRHRRQANSGNDARQARPEQSRDQIRFRERPDTVTTTVRRDRQTASPDADDLRRRDHRRDASSRAARNQAMQRTADARTAARAAANRNASRAPASAERRAAPTRSDVRRDAAAARRPATPAKPPVVRQTRRPDNRADRAAEEKRQRRSEAKERKESRAERAPARTTRQHRRRN